MGYAYRNTGSGTYTKNHSLSTYVSFFLQHSQMCYTTPTNQVPVCDMGPFFINLFVVLFFKSPSLWTENLCSSKTRFRLSSPRMF
jgi:hypothetical protein